MAGSGKAPARAGIVQQKTRQFAKFELTEQTRDAVEAWIAKAELSAGQYLFPSRQLLPGHRKLESTVRYFGIEVDDALAMSEQREI